MGTSARSKVDADTHEVSAPPRMSDNGVLERFRPRKPVVSLDLKLRFRDALSP